MIRDRAELGTCRWYFLF